MAGSDRFDSLTRALLDCLERYPEVLAAYVFGSEARGQAHRGSDVDIAVLVSDDVMKSDPLRYRLKLTADLASALARNDVDLVLLNQANPLLAHRVLRDGTLILERSSSARVRFQVRAVNRYLDTHRCATSTWLGSKRTCGKETFLVDVDIVHARIQRIRKCVSRIGEITRTHSSTEFLRDPDAIDIAEHNMQTAIQCVLDISNHILADLKAGVPEDHRTIFTMLASNNILPYELAQRLAEMACLRNVHGYFKIEGKPMAALIYGSVGLQHASMAVYSAFCDRVPVYMLLGNELENPNSRSVQDPAVIVRDFTGTTHRSRSASSPNPRIAPIRLR